MARTPLKANELSTYLGDDESVEYRLVSDDQVEREIDGSISTFSPAGDYRSVFAVTTARLLFVVGGADRGGDDAVIPLPYPDIVDVESTDGLFQSARIRVTTVDGETYRLSPDDGDLQAAAGHVQPLAEKCQRIRTLLEKGQLNSKDVVSDPGLDTSEIESSTTERTFAQAYSLLSDLDVDSMSGLPELRDEIETLWLHNYLARAEQLREDASAAVEEGHQEAAIDYLQAATETYETALSNATQWEFTRTDELREQRDAVEERLSAFQVGPAERGSHAVRRALEVSGEEAVETWLTAYDAYGEALDSDQVDLPSHVDDEDAALQYQRVWVARNAVDALRKQAVSDAAAVKSADDEARKREVFEQSREHLETAITIAEKQDLPTDDIQRAYRAIEEELALLEWEWGGEA